MPSCKFLALTCGHPLPARTSSLVNLYGRTKHPCDKLASGTRRVQGFPRHRDHPEIPVSHKGAPRERDPSSPSPATLLACAGIHAFIVVLYRAVEPSTRRHEGRRRSPSPRGPQHQQAATTSSAQNRRALALPPLPSPCSFCHPNASTKHCPPPLRIQGRGIELPISPLRPSSASLSTPLGSQRHDAASASFLGVDPWLVWLPRDLAGAAIRLADEGPRLHFPVSNPWLVWLPRDLGVVFAELSILPLQQLARVSCCSCSLLPVQQLARVSCCFCRCSPQTINAYGLGFEILCVWTTIETQGFPKPSMLMG